MIQGIFPADLNGVPTHTDKVTTLYGDTISGTIQGVTLHDWTADGDGKFHTQTDLKSEWTRYFDQLQSGSTAGMTAIQRLEGNAEAVFENTGLKNLSAADQARDREDVQREYDAIDAAMKVDQTQLGIDPAKPLTLNAYISIERTIQASPVLQELSLQGHGLNSPPAPKYAGYTNDFQNNVDKTTLYVGGGLDNGQNALTNFFDDVVLSHLPFSTVWQSGHLEQLNQNGNSEDRVATAIVALDDAMFYRAYGASDFSTTAPTGADIYVSPFQTMVTASLTPATTAANTLVTVYGDVISNQITLTPHTWNAGADGLFHTATDLKAEWKGYYATMLAGGGGKLTAVQRMEGNAEAVFENTGLNALSDKIQQRDREDVQREFDAMSVAIQRDAALGYDPADPFLKGSYLAMERAIQTDATLQELADQGHGFNNPPSARYRGYTQDFQNGVDGKTLFIGGGLDNNQNALTAFFDDVVISHSPFPTVWQGGHLEQLNQNGNAEDRVQLAIIALDDTAFGRTYTKADFSTTASVLKDGYVSTYTARVNASMLIRTDSHTVPTLFGNVIADSITTTAHVWIADAYGVFHTSTDLAAEWKADYATMLAGNGDTLTALQRQEGNAEAVFENTGLNKLSAADQARDREDAQREFDAIAAAMKIDQAKLGIDPSKPLTLNAYISLGRTIQGSPVLEELATQGHGLNHPPGVRYRGYTNDFQNNVDNTTLFIGGGLNHNQKAIADLFDDSILSHLPFPVVWQNAALTQLNQNGDAENTVEAGIVALDDTMYGRVYRAADFSTTAALGIDTYVSPFQSLVHDSMTPDAGPGQISTLYGDVISDKISTTLTPHAWVADKTGLFHTKANLADEWQDSYATMLAGHGDTLTAWQRMEGNAEAVFENTGIGKQSALLQSEYREDVQRSIDAIAAAMKIDHATLGLDTAKPLFLSDYAALEHTIGGNRVLQELMLQGHGLNAPPASRYHGYTNDIQNKIDNKTLYVGGGPDNGQKAVPDFMDDAIMTHLGFATIWRNGRLVQLNQDGNTESSVWNAITATNDTLFKRTYGAADFKKA